MACSVPCFISLLDPPKQLYKKGQVSKLFKVLTKIANFNGKKEITTKSLQEHFNFSEVDFHTAKIVLQMKTTWLQKWQLFKLQIKLIFTTRLALTLIGFSALSSVIHICFYGITYNSSQIGLASIQLDVIWLALVEAVCYIGCLMFIDKVPRKKLTLYCFICIAVGALILVVIGLLPGFGYDKLTQTMVTCLLIKGGVSVEYIVVYAYGCELFPTNVRGTAMGLGITISKFVGL
jgi:hypothetical protein